MQVLEVSPGCSKGKGKSLELTGITFEKKLAHILDRPFFPWKNVLVGFSLGQYILEGFLSFRQYKVLQRSKPPKVLEGQVSQEVFDKSQVRLVDSYQPSRKQEGMSAKLRSTIVQHHF